MSQPARRSLLLVTVLAAAAPLVACSDDTATPGPTADATTSTTSTTSSTTAATEPTAEAEVEAAYVAIIQASYARLQDPDPNDTSIATQHVGESLSRTIENNRQAMSTGRRYRFTALGPPRVTVRSVEITGPAEAVVLNCIVDDVVVFDDRSGAVLDDSVDVGEMRSVMRLDGGVWKLSTQTLLEEYQEDATCNS